MNILEMIATILNILIVVFAFFAFVYYCFVFAAMGWKRGMGKQVIEVYLKDAK